MGVMFLKHPLEWPFLLSMLPVMLLLPYILYLRISFVKKGIMRARQFKYMELEGAPEIILKTDRNFSNYFELPVMFWALCLFLMHKNIDSQLALIMAWVFCLSRYAHTYIHITRNHVLYRLIAWAIGAAALLIILLVALFKI